MTIHVSFDDLENLSLITDTLSNEGATIYEFELEDRQNREDMPSAIVWIKLSKENKSHSSVLYSVAELECVSSVQ